MATRKYRILVALLFLLCTISLVQAQCPSDCECLTDAIAKETFGEGNYVKCSEEACGYEYVKTPLAVLTIEKYCFKKIKAVDNDPPQVDITYSPGSPTTADKLTFTATASDPQGISKIEILVNARLVKTCTAASCVYSGGPYPAGTVTYLANAWDTSGNLASTGYLSLKVVTTIDRDLPSVDISHFPSSPTTADQVTFTATASDPGGIREIQILVNARKEKTCTASSCTYTGGPYPAGTVTYAATATDESGNIASTGYQSLKVIPITVTPVDQDPPQVDITYSPPYPTDRDQVTFRATASDPSGIEKIEILVNGCLEKTCIVSPCEYTGGPFPADRVTYAAAAQDRLGNIGGTGYSNFTCVESAANEEDTPIIKSLSDIEKIYHKRIMEASRISSEEELTNELQSIEEEKERLIEEFAKNTTELDLRNVTLIKKLKISKNDLYLDGILVPSVPVEIDIGGQEVRIEPSSKGLALIEGDVRAEGDIEFEYENNLLITFKSKKSIQFMPSYVKTKIAEDLKEIEIKDEENPKYVAKSEKKGKLLWFIPTTITTKIEINAENGKIVKEEWPWFGFLVTQIETKLPTASAPDLKFIDLTWEPYEPVRWVSTRFDYKIANFGDVSGPFKVQFFVNGWMEGEKNVDSIGPNGSFSSAFFYDFTSTEEQVVRILIKQPDSLPNEYIDSIYAHITPQNIWFNVTEGKMARSNTPIFYVLPDDDEDGISDVWEKEAIRKLTPILEMDEGEELFENSDHHVALFTRVTPLVLDNENRYIMFYFVWAFSKDYGVDGISGHNGDTELAIMVWKVIDDYRIHLREIYTHAHGTSDTSHCGVWSPVGISCNHGKVKWGWDEEFCSKVYFANNRLLLWCSQDKHALYPSSEVCEDVTLFFDPTSLVGLGEEDCGEGPQMLLNAYNIGENWHPYIDVFRENTEYPELEEMFPGEGVWGAFCGGLGGDDCAGSIGRNNIPDKLRARLEAVTGREVYQYIDTPIHCPSSPSYSIYDKLVWSESQPSPPADMIIENITWSPQSPSVGVETTVNFSVKNVGYGPAFWFKIEGYIDGIPVYVRSIDDFGSGETFNSYWIHTFDSVGEHEVKIVIDISDAIEFNKNDNELRKTIQVYPPINLDQSVKDEFSRN